MRNFKRLTVLLAVPALFSVTTANAKISCGLNAEDEQRPGTYSRPLWKQDLKSRGAEKHFVLLSQDGQAATEIPQQQIARGSDVNSIAGQTVFQANRYENGVISLWVSEVDPTSEGPLQLKFKVMTAGRATRATSEHGLNVVVRLSDKVNAAFWCSHVSK